jgi:GDP-mannose 6-dehydrogenase
MVTLAETLIGKGCDLKIYDPTIVLSSLKGANKRYIEAEIPHISSLLCDSVDCLLQHADVLVFPTTGKEALKVIAAAGERHTIVDLTHGALAKQYERTPRLVPVKVGQ